MKRLPKNLPKARRLSIVSRAQVVLFKTHMMSYKRLIKILECNLMLCGQAPQNLLAHPKLPKHPLAMVVKDGCYNVDINALCAQSQHSNVEQMLVESCDEAIGKENDNLKLEVKRLEQKVNVLEKQAKAQPSQDNHKNMMNKLENGKTVPKLSPQQQMRPTHHKKKERASIDEKIKYVRSVFLNARRPHIKNGIGYKSGDKHNSIVNSIGKEFIKFTKGNSYQEKKQSLNNTNHVSYANASYVSHISYHKFDASFVLMRNKFGKIVALYVGPHHKRLKTYV
jgi:hypothetical protein